MTRVELVACGSAYYASLVGAAAIQDWTGLPARANVGSEFRYCPPPLDARTLVIAVTQSGETADTIAPVRLARQRGCPVIAVTNTVGSAITREADAVLFLQAGPEIAVAASKTFVTQVTTLVILAAAIAKIRGSMSEEAEMELGAALRALPAAAARTLEHAAGGSEALARRYVDSRGFMFVGRGSSYPAALEGALKLKEVSYVHAEGYAAGELKHGPISLLDAECPLVAVATRSSVYDKLISNVMEGRARDARVIAVATEGDPQIERFADDVLWVPDTHEALVAGPRDHPAPALRLPHGGRPRHGCGPAPQPRQVGHGRVGDGRTVDRPGEAAATAWQLVPPGTTELGIDIIKVDRIRKSLERFGVALLRPRPDAGRAQRTSATGRRRSPAAGPPRRPVSKVLGLGVRGIGWRDIEIERMPTGQPAVRLHGRAAARASQLGMDRIAVSISHESDYAVAIAFGVRSAGGRYRLPARHRRPDRRAGARDPGSPRAAARRRRRLPYGRGALMSGRVPWGSVDVRPKRPCAPKPRAVPGGCDRAG